MFAIERHYSWGDWCKEYGFDRTAVEVMKIVSGIVSVFFFDMISTRTKCPELESEMN